MSRLDDPVPAPALLFGEAQGRIVVSCAEADLDRVLALAADHGVPTRRIGAVAERGGAVVIEATGGPTIDVPVAELAETYRGAIPRIMEAPTSSGE